MTNPLFNMLGANNPMLSVNQPAAPAPGTATGGLGQATTQPIGTPPPQQTQAVQQGLVSPQVLNNLAVPPPPPGMFGFQQATTPLGIPPVPNVNTGAPNGTPTPQTPGVPPPASTQLPGPGSNVGGQDPNAGQVLGGTGGTPTEQQQQLLDNYLRNLFGQISPNAQTLPFAQNFGTDDIGRNRGALNALAGIFANDPFGLPGDRFENLPGGIALNMLFGNAAQQGARSTESEGLFRDILSRLQGGAANTLNNQTAQTALGLGGDLDAEIQRRQDRVRSDVAASTNAARNRLADAGLLSGGGAPDALTALQAASSGALQQGLDNVADFGFGARRSDLGLQSDIARSAAGVQQGLEADPAQRLAVLLQQPFNPQSDNLINALFGIQGLNTAVEANRGGSFLERGGGQLIGGGLSGLGNILGALI